ncbi:carbohydrate kinase family protein [Phytohabitans sp. LJ34]|uniref:carbohydrate kinase family protein n=1 Tax=Phytohabitans sp. LJ34 TaxID=3452217 RepID=UPI003F8CF1AE
MLTVLGEAVVDLLPTDPDGGYRAHPGGSPLNVAVAHARLGEPTALLARTSGSAFGQLLHAHAHRNGVTVTGPADQPEPASLAVVTLDSDGVAGYDFYLDGTVDWQWRPAELAVPAGTTILHTGSLACYRPPGADAVSNLLTRLRGEGEILLSLDPNIRPTVVGDLAEARLRTTRLVSTAHVVKASSEDIQTLYPDQPVTAVARHWATLGPSLVVVTLGGEGAYAVHADLEVRRTAPTIDVVDTVGAGDAFTAGLLSALRSTGHGTPATNRDLDREQLVAVIDQAINVASVTCTRAGADTPRRADL